MGQRLNIEILENGEILANAYYHWSAYTSSSLALTNRIIEQVDKIKNENSLVQAVRLLETTGAKLTSDEIEIISKEVKDESFEEAENRNEGLIAISQDGIENTRNWEEGRVEIDLKERIVNFYVLFEYSKEEYLRDYDMDLERYEKIPIEDLSYEGIPFTEFSAFVSKIGSVIDKGEYAIRLKSGGVLSFVE